MRTTLVALSLVIAGTAAAERTGTPRLARTLNLDAPGIDGGLHAAAAGDTTFMGSWTFDATPSCSDQGWTPVDLTTGDENFGNYAGLLSGRSQYSTELCLDNLGCLWGFINGSTDTYACGNRASQVVVPYGDPQRGYLWNEIQSPLINLTGSGSTFGLRFSVYRALPFHDLVFYTWRVRSFHAGVPGPWTSPDMLYYSPMVTHADWLIENESIGALIEPGADQIQVALGAIDMAGVWAGLGDGACHSNAPYFDSIVVYRVAGGGPQWSVDFADLFQDNFASDGTATGTVRMDMARDINPRAIASIHPGDSLVVTVSEPTVGMSYASAGVPASGPAVYLHVRDVSPAKSGAVITGDALRWPVVATGGGWTTVRFDSVRTASGPVANRFCVDLNDALYTPGDTVLFYFSARDAAGRTTYWTEFVGPTASAANAVAAAMEVTCLPIPSHNRLAILYVDDTDGRGVQPYFDGAFLALGQQAQVDRYDVRGADELVGNGPGSRVRNVATQLADYYDTIIWSSGNLTAGLIGDGSGAPEKSPDAAMLVEFLQRKVEQGAVYLNGDHIAAELKQLQSPSAHALLDYIHYDLIAESHALAGAISPQVKSTPQSTFTHNGTPDSFFLYGGCPTLNSFCLMAPAAGSIAEMTYGGTAYASEVSQSTHTATGWKWVLLSGSGFEYIRDDELNGTSDRALHLHDILGSRELPGFCSDVTGNIESEAKGARISWSAGTCGAREMHIYRTADWGAANELIHVAPVPPWEDVYHDPMPFGRSAYYRLEALMEHGRTITVKTATIHRDTAVSEFTAAARSLGIEISWSIEDRAGIDALVVEKRMRGQSVFSPANEDSLLPPATTRLFDTAITPGKSYEYRLVMRYAGGWSTRGDIASVDAPHALALGQNVPNPFNPETRIPFLMPSAGRVEVAIFDVRGVRVRTLWNDDRPAGYGELRWDGRNEDGAPAASGVYFCRLNAPGQVLTRKLVLVR